MKLTNKTQLKLAEMLCSKDKYSIDLANEIILSCTKFRIGTLKELYKGPIWDTPLSPASRIHISNITGLAVWEAYYCRDLYNIYRYKLKMKRKREQDEHIRKRTVE